MHEIAHIIGHMEKQETEMKRKVEIETGNWKLETENRNGNTTS